MTQKPRIIWIMIGLLLIIALLTIVYEINFITENLNYIDDLKEENAPDDVIDYENNYIIRNIIMNLTSIILLVLVIFLIYKKKQLAWILALMVIFYLFFSNLWGLLYKTSNYYIVGWTEYPFFSLVSTIINILVIISSLSIIWISFRKDVKLYFEK